MQTPRTSSITVPHRLGTERRPWLGWLCAAALLCPHTGQARGVRFDVPPQSLGTALDSVAKEAALQILYPPEAVEGLTTRGVQGDYTPQEAIQRLLDGTGLRYEFLKDNTVTVSDAAKEGDSSPEKQANPEEEIVTLPQITVTASPWDDTSYNALDATTATKTDTPIMETPFSVQVVPRQVLEDQQVIRLEDALNVSGVSKAGTQGDADALIIRAFRTDTVYRDGACALGAPVHRHLYEPIAVCETAGRSIFAAHGLAGGLEVDTRAGPDTDHAQPGPGHRRALFPDGELVIMPLPDGPEGVYAIGKRAPDEVGSWPYRHVWLDQYSGEILHMQDPHQGTAGDKFLEWQFPLHTGDAFGLPGRILVCIAGFVPTVLYVTGFIRWRQKARANRRSHARTAETQAQLTRTAVPEKVSENGAEEVGQVTAKTAQGHR